MDRDALKRELTAQFQQSLDQAIQAVETAPDGRWIAASEWQIREIFQKLMAESYQRILQAKLDAADQTDQAAFSPSESSGSCVPVAAEQGAAGHRPAQRRR